jgi:hypothetical protein
MLSAACGIRIEGIGEIMIRQERQRQITPKERQVRDQKS